MIAYLTAAIVLAALAFTAWRLIVMATKFDKLTAAVQAQHEVVTSAISLVVEQTKVIREGGVDSVLLDGLIHQVETQTAALKTVVAGNALPVVAADPVANT